MPSSEERAWTERDNAAFKLATMDVLRIARQTGTPVIFGDKDGGGFRAISPDEYLKEMALSEEACIELGQNREDAAPTDTVTNR